MYLCELHNICRIPFRRCLSNQCFALLTSLESALSRRTDKKLLRDICEEAFRHQQELHQQELQSSRLELQLVDEKSGRAIERLQTLLKERTADLFFTKGVLNVIGVLEYLEDECRTTHILKNLNDRQEIWTQILQEPSNQDLVKCLNRASDERKRKSSKPLKLEEDISQMYQFASNTIHGRLSHEYYEDQGKFVYIVEGPLLPKHCQMLICICTHFGFPLKYRQVTTQHEEPNRSGESSVDD